MGAPREGAEAGEIRVGREGGVRAGEKERGVGESHEWRRTGSGRFPVEMHSLFSQVCFVCIAGRGGCDCDAGFDRFSAIATLPIGFVFFFNFGLNLTSHMYICFFFFFLG